jgi:hypothetical protein
MVPEDRSCLALVAGASRGRMAGQGPLLLLLASIGCRVALKKRGAHAAQCVPWRSWLIKWRAVLATAVASSRALDCCIHLGLTPNSGPRTVQQRDYEGFLPTST